jgi:hypothetical protein
MQDFREIGATLRNWGRWGEDDERGTVNRITPERLVAASKLVRRGAIFEFGIPFDASRPQPGGARINREFLIAAPPIKFTAAVGSPINPLAIK